VRLALFACAVLIAASCGGSVPAMRITRFSAAPEYHYPVFDRSISDPTVSRPVFDALRSLPPAPSGRVCPGPEYGLRYRLSFNESARVVLSVVIEGDGCDEISFSQVDRRTPDEAFRETLARALGVTKEDIFDVLPTEKRP
jgi:hypothetical protein